MRLAYGPALGVVCDYVDTHLLAVGSAVGVSLSLGSFQLNKQVFSFKEDNYDNTLTHNPLNLL